MLNLAVVARNTCRLPLRSLFQKIAEPLNLQNKANFKYLRQPAIAYVDILDS
jgi:hypothetical protein